MDLIPNSQHRIPKDVVINTTTTTTGTSSSNKQSPSPATTPPTPPTPTPAMTKHVANRLFNLQSYSSLDSFAEDFSKHDSQHVQPSLRALSPVGIVPNGALSRDRLHSKRVRRRLVYKNGECNISHANIKKRRQRYFADMYTTLVDIKWRWNLLIFVMAFTLSWLLFALIWWLICFSHGDFENYGKADNKPCVEEVYDFTTALLFSIETQHTIGYGGRLTTPNCPEAVLMMMVQSCFGVIIEALMTGLVFAKLSRPKKRAETLMFSKNAVITKRDGQLCLLFRVGDMRKSHIVEAHTRGILIKKRITEEGEVMPLYQYELNFGQQEEECKLFLVWPVILEHIINKHSPFFEMSYEDLQREQFELIVVLEGIVESTGMTTQARTSYLPGEILWGHRFERLVTFQKENGEYQIDYSRFHSTIPQEIPTCSAKTLAKRRKRENRERQKMSEEELDEEDTSSLSSLSNNGGSGNEGRGGLFPLMMKRSHMTQTTSAAPTASRPGGSTRNRKSSDGSGAKNRKSGSDDELGGSDEEDEDEDVYSDTVENNR